MLGPLRSVVMPRLLRGVLPLALVLPLPLGAQARPFEFTIANIMRGPELYGREPQRVRWSADSRWIYFYWNQPGTKWSEPLAPFRVRAVAGSTPERLTESQVDSAGPLFADGTLSRDRRWKAVAYEGDLYLVDMRAGTSRRLTQTVGNESAASIAGDGSAVFFVRDNNVYRLDISGGAVRQLTDVRGGPAPRDSSFTGQRGILRAQQRELFDAVRERARLDSIARANRRDHESLQPRTLYLAQGEQVGQLSVSPNGSALLITTSVPATTARQTDVPQYVTASGYTEPLRVRTKVGDDQSSGRIAYLPLNGGDAKWLRVIPTDTVRSPSVAFTAGWNDTGDAAMVFAVSRNYKSRFIHRVDASGALTTIDVLRDTAWVLTGRGGTNACGLCGGWIDGNRVWFTSEADGFAALKCSMWP
jgi:hypothetical protein